MSANIYYIIGGIAVVFVIYIVVLQNMMKKRKQQQLENFNSNHSGTPLNEQQKDHLHSGQYFFITGESTSWVSFRTAIWINTPTG